MNTPIDNAKPTESLSEEETAIRLQVRIGGIYRSTKNKQTYRIIAIAKHSETLEDLVIYESHSYKNALSDVWARPIKMFLEIVERDGVRQPRFILEEESK